MLDSLHFRMLALLLAALPAVPVSAADVDTEKTPQAAPGFLNDVVPILTRYGCNSGGCHGKATGQNGFRLSRLGFVPDSAHVALLREGRGRRVFPGSPDGSLLLVKASGRVPHGGGTRIRTDSKDYAVLRKWIEVGAPGPQAGEPTLVRVAVTPERQVLKPNSELQLKVTAFYSDGRQRDVTGRSLFETNLPEVADVSHDGAVTTNSRGGLFATMVRFGGMVGVFRGTVPFSTSAVKVPNAETPVTPDPAVGNAVETVNRLLTEQWNRLGVEPSQAADDFEFIRRASVDICGTLPTAGQVIHYAEDKRPGKRARLIDRLLERPEHASWFALKWAAILQNRGRGYSTGRQREGTALFTAWIRDSIAENKPYDRFVSEILTATGSQRQVPPAIWYRSVRTSQDYVESIAQSFLGVRIQCAQCHRHPAERWTQADYYSLAAVFARVRFKGTQFMRDDEVVFLDTRSEIRHPVTGDTVAPVAFGESPPGLAPDDDRRAALVEWLTRPDNRFFARSIVNRLWFHLMCRGIVDPVDDFRETNPPSNPELLNRLAAEFVHSGYRIKPVLRVILKSSTYQLSSRAVKKQSPHAASPERYFAHAAVQMLQAEQILDAIAAVTGIPEQFPGYPRGTRAIEIAGGTTGHPFLMSFSKPVRDATCECAREPEPSLSQVIQMLNNPSIVSNIQSPDGRIQRWLKDGRTAEAIIRLIYLSTVSRRPTPQETELIRQHLKLQPDILTGLIDLQFALLNSNEFLLRH